MTETLRLGTATTRTQTKLLLLGSGELGKEVAIEAQRLGVYVVACDRYDNAPAMQVAHARYVFPMLDAARLREVIEAEKPDFVVPEIEAIATDTLVALEAEGVRVIPTARAARLTMNREGIRRLAAEELGLRTSEYRFAETEQEYRAALREVNTLVAWGVGAALLIGWEWFARDELHGVKARALRVVLIVLLALLPLGKLLRVLNRRAS